MRVAPLGCPECRAGLPDVVDDTARRSPPRLETLLGAPAPVAVHVLFLLCPQCRTWLAVLGPAGGPRLARIPREIQALLLTGLLADGVPLEPVFAAAEEAGHAR